MTTLKKLEEMYMLQNKLNIITAGENWTSGVTKEGRPINWFRCIWLEAAEGTESTAYKHWKSIDMKDDTDNIKIELIDVWHFIMSAHIELVGYDTAVEELSIIEEHLNKAKNKNKTILDCFDSMIAKSSQRIIPFADFFAAVEAVFSFDDVYRLYLGKNCLNQFRQSNGYKQGTYIKNWNGEEDNVYMQKFMNENQDVTYETLMNYLNKTYASVKSI